MKHLAFILFLIAFISCKNEEKIIPRNIASVKIKTILKDSVLSIRAIDILNDGSLAFAANKNTFGLYDSKKNKWNIATQDYDSLDIQFRAVAHTATDFFMLSTDNPALLYKTTNSGIRLCYKENSDNVFYDSMMFWNDQEGIAIGDPTDDCMSIIITRNGGNTWTKLSCDNLPKVKDGEAAFAASNSNIAIVGNNTWVATGGKVSRILYSPDKGKTWEVFNTTIIQGAETTGMYSIAFYDALNGFAIGGNYTKPDANASNKIRTTDGGKTWALVAQNKNPGYRSCVQYIPNGAGKELIAIGSKGIDYSNDSGTSWKHISDEGFYTIRFLNDSVAYAAGRGRISMLIFRN